MKLFLLCATIVCVITLDSFTSPLETSASAVKNRSSMQESILGSIHSCGKLSINDYFLFDSSDLIEIAKRIVYQKNLFESVIVPNCTSKIKIEEMEALQNKSVKVVEFTDGTNFDGGGNIQDNINLLNELIKREKENGWK